MEKEKTRVGKFLQSIGRPLGSIVSIVGDITGIESIESIGKAILNDNKLTQEEKEIALSLIELDKQDVANARDMQKAALSQDDIFSKRFVYYFSSFWSFIAAALLIGIMFIEIPANNVRLVDTTFGFLLGTVLASMFTYFFGSSAGSAKKDNLIEKLKSLK
jgi:hypothetical protein